MTKVTKPQGMSIVVGLLSFLGASIPGFYGIRSMSASIVLALGFVGLWLTVNFIMARRNTANEWALRWSLIVVGVAVSARLLGWWWTPGPLPWGSIISVLIAAPLLVWVSVRWWRKKA